MADFKIPSWSALAGLGVFTWLLITVVVAMASFLAGGIYVGVAVWFVVKFFVEFVAGIFKLIISLV